MKRAAWGVLVLGALAAAIGTAAGEPSPLVVIDPGHGGSNSGALATDAADGLTSESQLTLLYARALAERLKQRGIDAVLTRSDNSYLTLRQRSKRANELGAAVFISIHANASPNRSQRGFETYILSPAALTVDAPALREGSVSRPGVAPVVAELLDDIERGVAQKGSARLATLIQAHLEKARPYTKNRGVKQDSMHVLLGATMPAVLVELGFIDHPVEGPELMSARTRGRVADSMADAIGAFLAKAE